jgi:dCMP deaminase
MKKNHDLFLRIATEISNLSYCKRKKVGAIIVSGFNIISFGYNGTISGFENVCECDGVTKKDVLHAESNAIIKCAKSTSSCENATMYLTLSPCFDCAKIIIQSGIKEVYYIEEYSDTSGINLLKKANINVFQIIP